MKRSELMAKAVKESSGSLLQILVVPWFRFLCATSVLFVSLCWMVVRITYH